MKGIDLQNVISGGLIGDNVLLSWPDDETRPISSEVSYLIRPFTTMHLGLYGIATHHWRVDIPAYMYCI